MAAAEPLRPRVYAHFAPERADARVFANFAPRQADGPVFASFQPDIWEKSQEALRAAGVTGPEPDLPPEPPLSKTEAYLATIASLLSPDDFQIQQKYITSQVAPGQAYDYAFPVWARHLILTNNDTTDTGTAAYLYYWYDNQQQGSKQLPQNYATLTGGQTISENSDFMWLTVYANSGASTQGWEIRFSGRKEDYLKSTKPGMGAIAPRNFVSAGGPIVASTNPGLQHAGKP